MVLMSPPGVARIVAMSEQNDIQQDKPNRFSRKRVLFAIGMALGIAVVCFTVVAILPSPRGPFFKAPLRSALIGLGLLGIACPFCVAGLLLKKRSAMSPYFEEGFIATVVSLFGFVCLGLGLLCIALSIYALVKRLLGAE